MKNGAYAALAGATDRPHPAEYLIGAYYFPNFHVDSRMELIHGKSWTEWEALKRAEPKFPGHQQPKVPAWGYLDESDPRVFERKIAAAHSAGITHFIFDWYWYDGEPFLEGGLEKGYLHAANKADLRFCLMWANHDWIDLIPARIAQPNPPASFAGTYDSARFDAVTDYVISRYFRDPSYLCIDGAPYFSIYLLGQLIDRMGSIDVARAAFARFRQKTQSAGFRDLHINAVAWGAQDIPAVRSILPLLGVKSTTSYTWAHHHAFPIFPATEYQVALEHAPVYWNKAEDIFGLPYHPNVSMGWDPSPRTCQSDTFQQGTYPYTPILKNNTPALFQSGLTQARSYLDRHGDQPRVITINAWNEWTEGSYLEPDSVHGMEYLDAIRNVFRS